MQKPCNFSNLGKQRCLLPHHLRLPIAIPNLLCRPSLCLLEHEKCNAFAKECLPDFNSNSAKGAALVITTFVANRSGFDRDGNADNEAGNGWGFYDLGMHNENFILKAKEMGLDTLVMGIRDADKIRAFLSIPETEIIVSVIAVGYGAVNPDKPKRKQAEDILQFL